MDSRDVARLRERSPHDLLLASQLEQIPATAWAGSVVSWRENPVGVSQHGSSGEVTYVKRLGHANQNQSMPISLQGVADSEIGLDCVRIVSPLCNAPNAL